MFQLNGRQGKSVVLEENSVKIVKKGGLFSAAREKNFPIRNISAVEVKKPGMTVGYIQFSIGGGQALNSSYTMTGGAYDAVKDENSVVFSDKKSYQVALEIKKYIDNYSTESKQQVATGQSQTSGADEILKFKKLLDEGVISQEEFETKKKQLLGL